MAFVLLNIISDLRKKKRRGGGTRGTTKSLFSAVFYDNQICELIHAILQMTDIRTHSFTLASSDKHTNAHRQNTHTQFKLTFSEC